MASAKFEKGSAEFAWFGEFWQMVQKHWIPDTGDDAYWESLVGDINQIYEKYKQDPKMERFAKKMLLAFEGFIEEECRYVGQR